MRQVNVLPEAVSSVEAAFARALENSANDGSIVLSAGSMFVTADVMQAWNKTINMSLRRSNPYIWGDCFATLAMI